MEPSETPIAQANADLEQLQQIVDQLPEDQEEHKIVEELRIQVGELPVQYNEISSRLAGELLEEQQFNDAVQEIQQKVDKPIEEMAVNELREHATNVLPLLKEQIEKLKGKLFYCLKSVIGFFIKLH